MQYLSALAYNTTADPAQAGAELLAFLGGCPPSHKPPGCTAADPDQFDYAYYQSPLISEFFGFADSQTWVLMVYDRAADVVVAAFKGTDVGADHTWNVDAHYASERLFDGSVVTGAPSLEVMSGFADGFKGVFLEGTVRNGLCTAPDGARSQAACPPTPMCFVTQQLGPFTHGAGAAPASHTRILLTGHSLGGAMAEIAAFYLHEFLSAYYDASRRLAISGLVTFGAPRTGYVASECASECGPGSGTSGACSDSCLTHSWPYFLSTAVPFQLRITKYRDFVPNTPYECTRCFHAPREIFYGDASVGTPVRVCQGTWHKEDELCSYGVNDDTCGRLTSVAYMYCGAEAHVTLFQNHYLAPEQDSSPLCSNSCDHALDGTCDDGGFGAQYAACAAHSDCTDCGYRRSPSLPPSPRPPPPPSPPSTGAQSPPTPTPVTMACAGDADCPVATPYCRIDLADGGYAAGRHCLAAALEGEYCPLWPAEIERPCSRGLECHIGGPPGSPPPPPDSSGVCRLASSPPAPGEEPASSPLASPPLASPPLASPPLASPPPSVSRPMPSGQPIAAWRLPPPPLPLPMPTSSSPSSSSSLSSPSPSPPLSLLATKAAAASNDSAVGIIGGVVGAAVALCCSATIVIRWRLPSRRHQRTLDVQPAIEAQSAPTMDMSLNDAAKAAAAAQSGAYPCQ